MKNETKVYVGMDVHKDTVMIAVLPERAREPTMVKRLSHDPRGIRRLLDRLARKDEVRACYEASGAGYVLERMIRGWGHACEIVAPSLIPRRPGAAQARPQGRRRAGAAVPGGRAGDDPGADGAGGAGARRGALPGGVSARGAKVAALHPEVPGAAGAGVPRGPELDGQAHDVAAHDSAGRGAGAGRPGRLRGVSGAAGLQAGPPRRAGPPDRGAGSGAGLQGSGRPLGLPQGDLDPSGDGAGDGDRGLPALRASGQADGLCRPGADRALEWGESAPGFDHEGGQQPGSSRAGAGGLELPLSASAGGGC